jgi:FkbM family methyltransferase
MRIAHSGPVQAAALAILATSSRGRRTRPLAKVARRAPLTADARRHTVTCLSDLYFGIIDAERVEFHAEIGAKEATASQRAIRLPSIVRAMAFEANPATHRRFAGSAELAKVSYENLALGDRNGTVSLHVGRKKGGRPTNNGRASVVAYPWSDRRKVVEVPMRRLDDRLGEGHSCSTALWIDVEGAHAMVLRGATATLRHTSALLIELEDHEFFPGQEWLEADVTRFLGDRGFVPLAHDAQSRHQFNVLFVPRSVADRPRVRSLIAEFRQQVRRRPT